MLLVYNVFYAVNYYSALKSSHLKLIIEIS